MRSCWSSASTSRATRKTILAACFINDLLTVLALGFIFSPFTGKTGAYFGGATLACVVLPFITPRFIQHYGGRPSELEAKFLLLMLLGLGGLATWSGREAVLPAYIVVGHPAEQMVRFAEGHDVDHIVVGHRGHTLFEPWLIGSVARQVVAYAHCAVTVVRQR